MSSVSRLLNSQIKGRYAQNPKQPDFVGELIKEENEIVVRIDDNNNLSAWLEVRIPIAKLKEMIG